jgi:hypothetical protein
VSFVVDRLVTTFWGMNRWMFLAPLLAQLILGGCSADDAAETKPVVSQAPALPVQDARSVACREGPTRHVNGAVGDEATFSVESQIVTHACTCQTTYAPYGCGGKICESEYDLGAPNTPQCDQGEVVVTPIEAVTATVDRSDCTVAAAIDPRASATANVTVRCMSEGTAFVTVRATANGTTQTAVSSVTFTKDGLCPPVPTEDDAGVPVDPDAGAGDAADGADTADAGDAGDPDAAD